MLTTVEKTQVLFHTIFARCFHSLQEKRFNMPTGIENSYSYFEVSYVYLKYNTSQIHTTCTKQASYYIYIIII